MTKVRHHDVFGMICYWPVDMHDGIYAKGHYTCKEYINRNQRTCYLFFFFLFVCFVLKQTNKTMRVDEQLMLLYFSEHDVKFHLLIGVISTRHHQHLLLFG